MKSKDMTGFSNKRLDSKTNSPFLLKILKCSACIFTLITTLAVFVPFYPFMPEAGLDPSWNFSISQAVQQKLIFGKEIIFNFGPFASIYTRVYHPATDHLMMLGSFILGLCYALTLLYLAKDEKAPYFLFAFLFFLAGFISSMRFRDSLFISYPLILSFCAAKYVSKADQGAKTNLNLWQIAVSVFVFAPLGLLTLIKGNFLLMGVAAAAITAFYFLSCGHRQLAFIALISPATAAATLWMYSGQPLVFLPDYFGGMLLIISGYTEAMNFPGNSYQVIGYLLAAIAILWVLIKSVKMEVETKLFLSVIMALFLFIAFKGGFVRQDVHAQESGSALVLAVLMMGLGYADRRLKIAFFLSITAFVYIHKSIPQTSVQGVFPSTYRTYVNFWSGLRLRITDDHELQEIFENSLASIRKTRSIPALQGTTDIYSYDQSYLLASNNQWNPRPVIQSYQVYTPLTRLNERHLRGIHAPDNILFNVQPIDRRLPSLEDGLSWPALFDNYTVTGLDNGLAYLRKNRTIHDNSLFTVLQEGTRSTAERVLIPATNTPVFAKIELKPTWLGKILELLYKPPLLIMELKLKKGPFVYYEVIPNMMDSGFFISPLVVNTEDFVRLAQEDQRFIKKNAVESFAVAPIRKSFFLWNPSYSFVLATYQKPR